MTRATSSKQRGAGQPQRQHRHRASEVPSLSGGGAGPDRKTALMLEGAVATAVRTGDVCRPRRRRRPDCWASGWLSCNRPAIGATVRVIHQPEPYMRGRLFDAFGSTTVHPLMAGGGPPQGTSGQPDRRGNSDPVHALVNGALWGGACLNGR